MWHDPVEKEKLVLREERKPIKHLGKSLEKARGDGI